MAKLTFLSTFVYLPRYYFKLSIFLKLCLKITSQNIHFIKNNNLTHSNRLAEIIHQEHSPLKTPASTAEQSINIPSKVTHRNPLKARVECTSHRRKIVPNVYGLSSGECTTFFVFFYLLMKEMV